MGQFQQPLNGERLFQMRVCSRRPGKGDDFRFSREIDDRRMQIIRIGSKRFDGFGAGNATQVKRDLDFLV